MEILLSILEVVGGVIMIIGLLFNIQFMTEGYKDFDYDFIGYNGFFVSLNEFKDSWRVLENIYLIPRMILWVIMVVAIYAFVTLFAIGTLRWVVWLIVKREKLLEV